MTTDSASEQKTNGATAPKQEAQTIDQVRELLFGSEQRGLEERITAMQADMEANSTAFERRMEKMQADMAKTAEENRQRTDEQVRQIGESIKALGDAILKLPR